MAQQFIFVVGILILAARLGGELSKRLRQPAVLGELLAGVLLGPSLLNVFQLPGLDNPGLQEVVRLLAELGVVLLMFLAGLEIELGEMLKTGRAAALAGLLGVLAPLVLGTISARLFGYPVREAAFIGIVLSATSVSISAQTLLELGVLRRREGLTLLGAAVFDDVLAILALSVFLAFTQSSGGLLALSWGMLRVAGYLVLAIAVGFKLVPRVLRWAERLKVNYGLLSVVLVLILFGAWTAEALGMLTAITGAFLIGLAVARSPSRQRVEHDLAALTYGFFAPLFFVNIGLQANARAAGGATLVFGLVLVVVAVISKIVGSGLGAWWGGLKRPEAFRLGLGMVSRGEVGLIVASVGLGLGIIDPGIFAQIVLVVLATTLVTPLLLRAAYARAGGQVTAPGTGSRPAPYKTLGQPDTTAERH